MARTRKTAVGRGSVEAVEKRRTARRLNALFSGKGKRDAKLDGRTEKRRKRLLKELKEGKAGKPLKAIDMVSHANELLKLGETIASIRKNGVKTSKVELSDDVHDVIKRTQAAYDFNPRAWRILGYKLDSPAVPSKIKRNKPASRASKPRARKAP